jgi:hypothetical protein
MYHILKQNARLFGYFLHGEGSGLAMGPGLEDSDLTGELVKGV